MHSSVLRSLTARRTAHYYDFCKQLVFLLFFSFPVTVKLGLLGNGLFIV